MKCIGLTSPEANLPINLAGRPSVTIVIQLWTRYLETELTDFAENWHRYWLWQVLTGKLAQVIHEARGETVNFGSQEVKDQGHEMSKLYVEDWPRHCSRPVRSSRFLVLPYHNAWLMKISSQRRIHEFALGGPRPFPPPSLSFPPFPSFPSRALPSHPISSPTVPSPPLRSRPPVLRLGGLGERSSSPSGSGRSPARPPNGFWWIVG